MAIKHHAALILLAIAIYVLSQWSMAAISGASIIEQAQLAVAIQFVTIVLLLIIAFVALVIYKHTPEKPKQVKREKYIRINIKQ